MYQSNEDLPVFTELSTPDNSPSALLEIDLQLLTNAIEPFISIVPNNSPQSEQTMEQNNISDIPLPTDPYIFEDTPALQSTVVTSTPPSGATPSVPGQPPRKRKQQVIYGKPTSPKIMAKNNDVSHDKTNACWDVNISPVENTKQPSLEYVSTTLYDQCSFRLNKSIDENSFDLRTS